MPTFRPVAKRVLQLLDDDMERNAEVADLVLVDAGLTLRVLSEANLAVAPLGASIGSVAVALEIIGREALRAILTDVCGNAPLGDDDESLSLFRHLLITSLVSESLARIMGTVDPDAARATGLLHDVGAWNPESRHDARGLHARQGARVLRRAGLPDEICQAVGAHHDPPGEATNRAEDLVDVLRISDRISVALCTADSDGTHSPDIEETLDPRLRGLARLALDRASREVADGVLVLGTLLGIPALTLDSIADECRRLLQANADPPSSPAGLAPEIRRGLEAVRRALNEAEALRTLMRVVRDAPGVRSALLVLKESGEAMLEGHPDKRPFFVRFGDLAKIAERFAAFLERICAGGPAFVRRGEGVESAFDALKWNALLAVPVWAATKSVGTVLVPDPAKEVSENTAAAFGLVATATGEVLESLQLARGSYLLSERIATDSLTGVLNRGPFFERFAAEVRAANRYRRPLALAMIDIDYFKGWNDKYGHQVGDRILRDVSKTIRDCAREGDAVGRYGGDEFVVSLPGCNAEQALAFAERVRSRVESLGAIMLESCYELELTVSIGVAAATTWPCESDVLLFRADHALYRGKDKGRNRVCTDQV